MDTLVAEARIVAAVHTFVQCALDTATVRHMQHPSSGDSFEHLLPDALRYEIVAGCGSAIESIVTFIPESVGWQSLADTCADTCADTYADIGTMYVENASLAQLMFRLGFGDMYKDVVVDLAIRGIRSSVYEGIVRERGMSANGSFDGVMGQGDLDHTSVCEAALYRMTEEEDSTEEGADTQQGLSVCPTDVEWDAALCTYAAWTPTSHLQRIFRDATEHASQVYFS
jgi:hypothetical protein